MAQDRTDHLAALPLPLPHPAATVGEPYDAFFRREHPRLVALAIALAGPDRGEDIAQEALLRAHRSWDRIARYDKPGAWARRVTVNLATSSHRRRGAERRAVVRLAARPDELAPAPEVDGFWDLVRSLPPRQAAVVALHYLEDLSVADVAATLDCAEGTVKAHLHQARASLADRLARVGSPDGTGASDEQPEPPPAETTGGAPTSDTSPEETP